jgi:hypothetical protein
VAGLDVSDYNNDDSDDTEPTLDFVHRESTTLKNDEASEYQMQLDEPVPTILDDYLEETRPSVTDEKGREPLLTAGDGRLSPETLKKYAYKWSRPCKIGLGCPHNRDPDTCEAAQKNNSAYKCPSSRSPHQYRTGYITDQRNRGVSAEAIDIRCDVTPRVQDLHYDQPDDSEEHERVEDELRNADDDPDSGFCHS